MLHNNRDKTYILGTDISCIEVKLQLKAFGLMQRLYSLGIIGRVQSYIKTPPLTLQTPRA